MNKVSIIMPSLNVGKFIDECLNSVRNQTLEDIEILVIDAGSTDGTLEIIKSHAEKDSRIRLINSTIKSYGYQMNLGISEAKSEYIGIVETDDVVSSDMFEKLYDVIKTNNCDYVKCNHDEFVAFDNSVLHQKSNWSLTENLSCGEVFNPSENLGMILCDYYVWQGIYSREFLLGNNIKFNESMGAAYQDVGFLFQVNARGKRAIYVEDTYYSYRRDNDNSSVYNEKGFSYVFHEYEFIAEVMKEELEEKRELQSIFYTKMFFQTIYRVRLISIFHRSYENAENNIEAIRSQLKKAVDNGVVTEWDFPNFRWKELKNFLYNVKLLSQHYDMEYDFLRAYVKDFVDFMDCREKIIIFGSGKWGKFCNALLKKAGVTSKIYFCDNNENLVGQQVDGTDVLSVSVASEYKDTANYVVANLHYAEEMRGQLENSGVEGSRIRKYSLGCDFNLFYLF